MVLNFIWLFFFFGAFVACLFHWLVLGDATIFNKVVQGSFEMSKTAFEIGLGLTGILCFWLGIMKIGEKAGAVQMLGRLVDPLFRRLFPGIPSGHPATGSMLMNISANLLGLDNAATPMGLKAMKELQELNEQEAARTGGDKEAASDAQVLFVVLHSSSLTLLPVGIMTYRAQLGAANPADVFLPILLATFFSTMAGLVSVSFFQNIRLRNPVVMAWLVGLTVAVLGTLWYFMRLSAEQLGATSALISGLVLLGLIVAFMSMAVRKQINAFESFIEGAREGFNTAIMVVPYLVAILVGIAVFRASGAMDFLMQGLAAGLIALGAPADIVPALPTALMKPLSGSGARGMMIDTMKTFGADSFAGRLSCLFQGATDTTFYVIAVYFGSVAIRKTRHTLTCSLIADLVGAIAAICMAYLFFPPR
ncbi:nucleoside recognition domain-containing protein [Uliginosibacterium sp. H3]|uniref:Nucleoside recognition domain-containing protein n=1 Tax=Uliginosibacterium silvisoli TaxID=3114758 RepID=A0ABU6K0Q5_9RHOO|nr:nucleoside recognition domain-containing protein [Uliginosibacterium sp. H3]